ncbi:MAG: hypothetical protein U0231_09940 [Nitrospiraceae bacterium]
MAAWEIARRPQPAVPTVIGIFRIWEGNHGQPDEEGHRASGAHGMFFEDFLKDPI